MLSPQDQTIIINFLHRYLLQMFNTVFAAILQPKEALDFFYDRLYFAYSSEKNLLTNNIKKLENMYQDASELKVKMILKITRPMVKINYLLHADKKALEILKLKHLDLDDVYDSRKVVVIVDNNLSKVIGNIFAYKKNTVNDSFDSITEFIGHQIDALIA